MSGTVTLYSMFVQPKAIPVVGTIPFMVFGADVTHPTSFNQDDPSIAAVCASYDRTLGRYMSRVIRQVGLGTTGHLVCPFAIDIANCCM